MDPAFWTAIGGFGGALIGALIGLAVALFTNHRADLREEKRLNQERELKQLELEDKRREGRRAQRREAYMELVAITKQVDPKQVDHLADLWAVLAEIELLSDSPRVIEAADALQGSTVKARERARELARMELDPAEDPMFRNLFGESQDDRDKFIKEARLDLDR